MARARWQRVAIALLVGVPLAVGLVFGAFHLRDRVPERTWWRLGLGTAVALEVAYLGALAAVVVSGPILLVQVARRRGGPLVNRALALAVSLAISFALAEGLAAVWEARTARDSALPVGGLRPRTGREKKVALPEPQPIELPGAFVADAQPSTLRIVMVGESSAEGVPYNAWSSPGRLIAWKLQEALPDRVVELETIASSGETLESQHRKLARLRHRPDLLIVYCGHNEFSSRFPWSRDWDHYQDARAPSSPERTFRFVESVSPLCRTARKAAETCRVAIPPPPDGHRDLVDVPVYTPEEYAVLRADFARRLGAIVAWANQVGALTVLIPPAGNDSGFEPSRSFLPPETTAAQRAEAAREFQAARSLEATDVAASLRAYESLLRRFPTFAEAHHRLARLLEAQREYALAYEHDRKARDLDGLPMRMLTDFQRVYQEVADEHDLILLDMQPYFHAIGNNGLLDDHLFFDAMHPSLRGQIALAQGVLGALQARRAFGWPEATPAPVFDPAEVVERGRFDAYAWYTLGKWGAMVHDLTAPAHYDPSRRRARVAEYEGAVRKLQAGVPPESVGMPSLGRPAPVPPYPVDRQGRPAAADAAPR